MTTETTPTTITEILYSSHIIDMEGMTAGLEIIADYETRMTSTISARYPGAEYTLEVRANVSGAGSGIHAYNADGSVDSLTESAIEALSNHCMEHASDGYWAERQSELKALAAEFTAIDLSKEAAKLAANNSNFRRLIGKNKNSQSTEVLVVEDERAGICTGGDSVWGYWDESTQTIEVEDPQGSPITLDINGAEL